MKIALVVYQFIKEKGGVESYVFNLSRQLLDRGHEVHIFSHRFAQDQDKQLTFHYVPAVTFWSPLKYWTFAINAPKTIKKTKMKFDLVHGFTRTLSQDVYRVGGGCHWDYMMHTYPWMQSAIGRVVMCLNPRHSSILLLERSIFKKKFYKQITCISEQCKREILHHYKLSPDDVEVIYNGVDTDVFTPQNRIKYRNAVRDKYAIAPDDILLLFVGSGFKRKGLKHVIDALPLLDESQKIKLLVVGKGNIREYQRFAKEKGVLDKLIFAGVTKHIHEIYAGGDIFVFPSEYDAFGTACLEAMASGLPVIASRTSGVSEIISHGKDGFIINHPIDAGEIAKYISKLSAKEEREYMGFAARQKAEAYSFDVNIQKTLHIYQKVLDNNSTQMNRYTRNNIRWLAKGTLPVALKEMFDSPNGHNNCEIIRNGQYKKVLRYTDNQESFYIKQYKVRDRLEGIKSLFFRSKARREWDCSHRLLRSNVLTAEPIAVGEKRSCGMLTECYIVSKAVPNTTTVKERLTSIQQSPTELLQKNILLKRLVYYIKTVHDHGIFHGELHAENVLVGKDNPALFYLLDLGRTVFKKSLSLSLRIQELSRLLYSVTDICTDGEITGMIHEYANQTFSPKDREIFCTAVSEKIYRIKYRLWHSRTRKCLKTNNVFKASTYANYTVNMRNEWDIDTLVALINKHTLSFREYSSNIIKTSPKIGITCVPVTDGNMKSVCIKEHKYPSALKGFSYFFRNSPARRAWIAAHGLIALNFRTPKPIALVEEKRAGILKKSFILMEGLSACLPCNKYVSERFSSPPDKITCLKKRRFVVCLAKSFKQLHNFGIYHGDLKANNIMVRESQDRWDFFYLDLDRVCFNNTLTRKKRITGLSQLNASIPNCITYADRLRFYQAYADVKKLNEENKRMLQAIIRLSIQREHVWNPKR